MTTKLPINLNDLLRQRTVEGERIEYKTGWNPDPILRTLCAFANDLPNHRQPGYLLVGVRDKGQRSGLKVTDELLKNLGAIRSDGNVLPQPVMNVAHFNFNDGDVAVVEVLPSDLPPVRAEITTAVMIAASSRVNPIITRLAT